MPTEKEKSKGGRPPGSKTDPSKRGANQKGDRNGAEVLGPQDDKLIIAELRRFSTLVTIAAKLNVSRKTLAKYIHTTKHLQEELEDRDEAMIDLTERSLFDAAIGNLPKDKDGRVMPINVNAATFLLERKGKERGYSQHIETSVEEVPTFTFCRRDANVPVPKQ